MTRNLKKGPAQQFNDFKECVRSRLDANKPPRPQLDKLVAHYNRLAEQSVNIHMAIKGMLLLQVLPQHWETSIPNIVIFSENMTQLDITGMMDTIEHLYNADQVKKSPRISGPTANKLSAIRCKPGNPFYSNQKNKGKSPSGSPSTKFKVRAPSPLGLALVLWDGGQYQSGNGKKRRSTRGSGNGKAKAHVHIASSSSLPFPTSSTITSFSSERMRI
jgi:hypothetical protein